jgi:hypothetical protein
MQQAKCIKKKSINVRRFGEKVTHRYHSVDALNFVFTPEGSPWANACLAEGDFGVGRGN